MNSRPPRFPFLPTLCLLGACLGLVACGPSAKKSGRPAPAAVPVRVAEARVADVPVEQDAIGTVTPLNSVAVKSQVDGVIARVFFRDGDDVKAGDPLVALDRRPFEAELAVAQAALEQAEAEAAKADADLARGRKLDRGGVISAEELAQYETAASAGRAVVAARRAALDTARLRLGYADIAAPISGRAGRLALREGSLVKANDAAALLTINQLAPVAVVFPVPENQLAAVRAAFADGIAATAVLAAGSAEGRVDYIDNAVDPATGTISLRATFENKDLLLWPGQFARVRLRLGVERGVVLVPAEAVQVGQNESHVFVVKKDRLVEVRPVRTGRAAGPDLVVSSGLRAGEIVVTEGQLRLVEGAAVSIEAPRPAAAQP